MTGQATASTHTSIMLLPQRKPSHHCLSCLLQPHASHFHNITKVGDASHKVSPYWSKECPICHSHGEGFIAPNPNQALFPLLIILAYICHCLKLFFYCFLRRFISETLSGTGRVSTVKRLPCM